MQVGSIENGVIHREPYGQGFIFKDENAFLNHPDLPYYVAELADDVYTANDFLEIAKGDIVLATIMFYSVDWQSPWTWMDEYEREEHE